MRWAIVAALAWSCRGNVADPEPVPPTPPTIRAVDADLLVPWSFVVVHGDGFLQRPAGTTLMRLEGAVDGRPAGLFLTPQQSSAQQVQLLLTPEFVDLFGGAAATFDGTMTAQVTPNEQSPTSSEPYAVTLRFAPTLEPKLTSVATDDIAPGARLGIRGDGLLSASEGRSAVVLAGDFETTGGVRFRVDDAELPLVERVGRTAGMVYLRPAAVGLAAGRFEGRARLRTEAADGTVRESAPIGLTFEQGAPRVDTLDPLRATRGQVLTLRGRGFLPNEPGAESATLVRAEGIFHPTFGDPAPVALALLPETWVDNSEVRLALRTRLETVVDGDEVRQVPVGLGTTPGVFDGTLTMELMAGSERVRAEPVPLRFEVTGAAQTVYLRYLPGFRDALVDFGLADAEADIRARVLEVCRRDYAGLRVYFTERQPLDWAEYVTLEIGGRDPNRLGLFGLDNTPVKDHENLRLDELLGGRNAESEALGSLAFGGVFIASFMTLSPGHPEASILSDPLFDVVFGPFSPLVGDDAVPFDVGAALTPERARQLQTAVDALGNLVGSTITHEVGHAVGLAAYGEQTVHNPRPTEGALMDAGSDRPFSERAALGGSPPARFVGPNRAYLRALFGEDR